MKNEHHFSFFLMKVGSIIYTFMMKKKQMAKLILLIILAVK